jgi:hypothetical protein
MQIEFVSNLFGITAWIGARLGLFMPLSIFYNTLLTSEAAESNCHD